MKASGGRACWTAPGAPSAPALPLALTPPPSCASHMPQVPGLPHRLPGHALLRLQRWLAAGIPAGVQVPQGRACMHVSGSMSSVCPCGVEPPAGCRQLDSLPFDVPSQLPAHSPPARLPGSTTSPSGSRSFPAPTPAAPTPSAPATWHRSCRRWTRIPGWSGTRGLRCAPPAGWALATRW